MIFAKKNRLDWDDLRVVLAIANGGTLSGAARSLGVAHSTVFRRLGEIEQRMGVRLFDRFRDGYAATAAGETAAGLAAQFADEISALELKLSGQDLRVSGTVRLTTTDTIGEIVVPHLPALRTAQPDIRLEMAISNAMASLTHRQADIAIRPTADPPEALIGRRIADIAHAIFGTPAYLSRHSNRDLTAHEWIGLDDALTATTIGRWMNRNIPDSRIICRVDALPALRDAALAGMGLALLPCYVGDAAEGLRRAVKDIMPEPRSALWLLTHDHLKRNARVRAVMDFLSAALGSERALFEGRRRRAIRRL